ncbi:collagen alpha-1(I) chain-like [Marmota flaviventris]|uniref:collagen alpha-1(I) chain-like n=1 Tax=Marmota flaviventris TaxID=93162 RepID=UPI003A85A50A
MGVTAPTSPAPAGHALCPPAADRSRAERGEREPADGRRGAGRAGRGRPGVARRSRRRPRSRRGEWAPGVCGTRPLEQPGRVGGGHAGLLAWKCRRPGFRCGQREARAQSCGRESATALPGAWPPEPLGVGLLKGRGLAGGVLKAVHQGCWGVRESLSTGGQRAWAHLWAEAKHTEPAPVPPGPAFAPPGASAERTPVATAASCLESASSVLGEREPPVLALRGSGLLGTRRLRTLTARGAHCVGARSGARSQTPAQDVSAARVPALGLRASPSRGPARPHRVRSGEKPSCPAGSAPGRSRPQRRSAAGGPGAAGEGEIPNRGSRRAPVPRPGLRRTHGQQDTYANQPFEVSPAETEALPVPEFGCRRQNTGDRPSRFCPPQQRVGGERTRGRLLLPGFQLLLRGFQLPSTPLAHGAQGPTLPLSELQEPVASGLPECVWLLCELLASQARSRSVSPRSLGPFSLQKGTGKGTPDGSATPPGAHAAREARSPDPLAPRVLRGAAAGRTAAPVPGGPDQKSGVAGPSSERRRGGPGRQGTRAAARAASRDRGDLAQPAGPQGEEASRRGRGRSAVLSEAELRRRATEGADPGSAAEPREATRLATSRNGKGRAKGAAQPSPGRRLWLLPAQGGSLRPVPTRPVARPCISDFCVHRWGSTTAEVEDVVLGPLADSRTRPSSGAPLGLAGLSHGRRHVGVPRRTRGRISQSSAKARFLLEGSPRGGLPVTPGGREALRTACAVPARASGAGVGEWPRRERVASEAAASGERRRGAAPRDGSGPRCASTRLGPTLRDGIGSHRSRERRKGKAEAGTRGKGDDLRPSPQSCRLFQLLGLDRTRRSRPAASRGLRQGDPEGNARWQGHGTGRRGAQTHSLRGFCAGPPPAGQPPLCLVAPIKSLDPLELCSPAPPPTASGGVGGARDEPSCVLSVDPACFHPLFAASPSAAHSSALAKGHRSFTLMKRPREELRGRRQDNRTE